MDVANMLSNEPLRPPRSHQASDNYLSEPQKPHQYPTRHSVMYNAHQSDERLPPYEEIRDGQRSNSHRASSTYSAVQTPYPPKNVAFELLFDDRTNNRARLPMRVQIFPHDTTESIVTTVKNFYGLYEGTAKGVSFEDEQGNTLIARYENFKSEMIVYVRVIPDYSQNWQTNGQPPNQANIPMSGQRTTLPDAAFDMAPPQPAQILTYGQTLSRPPSRMSRKQSASPRLGGAHRSTSMQKTRSRSGIKSREESFQAHLDEQSNEVLRGYNSSDGECGSVSSSRKARNEQLASAEISLENILEGGRRQRAKFESSELPLFVPPQVPATNSISSISPQRRSNAQENPSPFARPVQRSLTYYPPLQSPQSFGFVESPNKIPQPNAVVHRPQADMPRSHRLRDRVSAPGPLTRLSGGLPNRVQGPGILPTPDPTIASCISDEDVALQLMRLGDASNFSAQGRTSASTQDDTFSGRADIASSASSEMDSDGSDTEHIFDPRKTIPSADKTKTQSQYKYQDWTVNPHLNSAEASDDGENLYAEDNEEDEFNHPAKKTKLSGYKHSLSHTPKQRNHPSSKKTSKATKLQQSNTSKKMKPQGVSSIIKTTMSPPSTIPQSRKTSIASSSNYQNQNPADEDLSTKPRCQRCRKSKKGCDRQRPCQRCKDAGIGVDGCVSEDEGNGRKGRFGRHMGVSVKKEAVSPTTNVTAEEIDNDLDGALAAQDKAKKRKRV